MFLGMSSKRKTTPASAPLLKPVGAKGRVLMDLCEEQSEDLERRGKA